MEGGLFDSKEYKPRAFLDFAGLPAGVYPTSVKMLGQGSDTLMYREADSVKGISPAQHRLFSSVVRNTNHPDAAGSNTVVVVTGLPERSARSMFVYDHMSLGEPHKLRPCNTEDVQAFIQQWFFARQGRR